MAIGGLASKLFGTSLRKAAPTPDLVKQGSEAKPVRPQEEQDVLSDIVNPVDEPAPPRVDDAAPEEPAGITSRDAEAVIDAKEGVPNNITKPDPEKMAQDIETELNSDLENRTWERNINLDYVRDADELGAVLEVNARNIDTADHQALDEIRASVDEKGHVEIMRDVLNDTSNPRALTSEQLLAGREMLLGLTSKVKSYAQKIVDGSATDEDRLLFDKFQEQAVMLQSFMQGSIRESARALNSMKIVAQTVNTGDIAQLSQQLGSSTAYVRRAEILMKLDNEGATAGELINKAGKLSKFKDGGQALVNLWVASLLTGVKTHAVNMISNSFYGTLRTLAVKPVAAGVGTIKRAMGNTDDRVVLAEVGAELAGFRHGWLDALKMGKDVWVTGTFKHGGEYGSSFGGHRKVDEAETASPKLAQSVGLGGVPGVSHTLNAGQRVLDAASFGALSGADEVFKALQYRKSLYALAVRQAYMEEIPESQIPDFVNDRLNNVTKDMHDQAIKDAEDVTFTNRENVSPVLSKLADALIAVSQAVPPLKMIVPFIRTPTALFDRTLKFTPFAVLQKEFRTRVEEGGPNADMAIAEMVTGTVLLGGMMYAYNEGVITGDGPSDYRQRKALQATGWQPNSIKVGGTYISLARGFDPIAPPILAVASLMDRAHYADEKVNAMEIAGGAIFALAKYYKEGTYMQGISELFDVIDGRKNSSQYFSRMASSAVPALLRDTAQIQRGVTGKEELPRVPASNQFWDQLRQGVMNRLPFTEAEAIQRYWDGTPVVAGGGEALFLYNSVSPVKASRLQGTDGRKIDEANEALVENYVKPSDPVPTISLEIGGRTQSGVKINLLNDLTHGAELYDKMVEFVGESRRKMVEAVVDSSTYKKMVETGRAGAGESDASVLLERALSMGQKEGKMRFVQWLVEEQESGNIDPERYGDKFQYLQPEELKSTLTDWQRDMLPADEVQALGEVGAKGIPSRDPVEAPRYVPNI